MPDEEILSANSSSAYKEKVHFQSCWEVSSLKAESIPESVLLPCSRTMVSLVVLSILVILVPSLCFEAKKNERYDTPNACCFHYATRKIRNVVACYETSSRCPKPGVIVITNTGRQFCVHPRKASVCGISSQPETSLKMTKEGDPQKTPPYADSIPYLGEDNI
ncbi:C-C motif chemokine 3-like [Notamacropus eugenii]|uniref:C-C motif chemokine 3-like n=1 Tax=Notamacropus eugenii TaxID=9315 RepID=UPI003B67A101